MPPETIASIRLWAKTLPPSRMVYPDGFVPRLKYFMWRAYTPFHPFFRDLLLALRIIQHSTDRQDFLLGKIAPQQTMRGFISFLIEKGYGNHFVAWKDDGEVMSLRFVKDFVYQYHLRIFEDGEVRGHYEYTPESHPILHLQEKYMSERRSEFLQLLGDRIT